MEHVIVTVPCATPVTVALNGLLSFCVTVAIAESLLAHDAVVPSGSDDRLPLSNAVAVAELPGVILIGCILSIINVTHKTGNGGSI